MSQSPEPPEIEARQDIKPELKTIMPGTLVWRIFFASGDFPVQWDRFRYFGPTANRFDHHLLNKNHEAYLQGRGIMYLSVGDQAIPSCLAEVFQTTRIIDRTSRSPTLVGFKLQKSLTLLNMDSIYSTAKGGFNGD
jgi:hypothetical protein